MGRLGSGPSIVDVSAECSVYRRPLLLLYAFHILFSNKITNADDDDNDETFM